MDDLPEDTQYYLPVPDISTKCFADSPDREREMLQSTPGAMLWNNRVEESR
jgi:hypothetical protein